MKTNEVYNTLITNTKTVDGVTITTLPAGMSGKGKRVKKAHSQLKKTMNMKHSTRTQFAMNTMTSAANAIFIDYQSGDWVGHWNYIVGDPGTYKTSSVTDVLIPLMIEQGEVQLIVLSAPRGTLFNQMVNDIKKLVRTSPAYCNLPYGKKPIVLSTMKDSEEFNFNDGDVVILIDTIQSIRRPNNVKKFLKSGKFSPSKYNINAVFFIDEVHNQSGHTSTQDIKVNRGTGIINDPATVNALESILNSAPELIAFYPMSATLTPSQEGVSNGTAINQRIIFDTNPLVDANHRTVLHFVETPVDGSASDYERHCVDSLKSFYNDDRKQFWDSLYNETIEWFGSFDDGSGYFKQYVTPQALVMGLPSSGKNGVTVNKLKELHKTHFDGNPTAVTYLAEKTYHGISMDTPAEVLSKMKANVSEPTVWITNEMGLLGNSVPTLSCAIVCKNISQDVDSGPMFNNLGRTVRHMFGKFESWSGFFDALKSSGLDSQQQYYLAMYFKSLNTSKIFTPETRLMVGKTKTYKTKNHRITHHSESVKTRFLKNHWEYNNPSFERLFINGSDIAYLSVQLARAEIEKGLMCDGCVKDQVTGLPECLMTWWKNERRDHPEKSIEDIYLGYRNSLHVHHVDLDKTNGDTDNGQTLCPNYHGYVHQEEGVGSYTIGENVKVAGRVKSLTKKKNLATKGIKAKTK